MRLCEEKVKSGNISSDLLFANVRKRFTVLIYGLYEKAVKLI